MTEPSTPRFNMNSAYVHSIESFATHDGSGIRACVFLCGCPMRCVYCHNPDTWNSNNGTLMSSGDVVKKLLRFKPYFRNKGGATFSGGEPLLYPSFLVEAMRGLRAEGVGSFIDTSGSEPLSSTVKTALSEAEAVILDIKFASDELYVRHCGRGIKNTLDTLDYLEKIGKPVWLRTVIVPNINDREEDISRYHALTASYSCVRGYDLLPFHTMGFSKYIAEGLENPLLDTPAMKRADCDRLQKFLDGLRGA